MAGILDKIGLPYQRNQQIGRYNVDFLVDKALVIECFGDYWHCNPALDDADCYNRSLHMTAVEKWRRDEIRRSHIVADGFMFLVFWESDIKAKPDEIRHEIEAVIFGMEGRQQEM